MRNHCSVDQPWSYSSVAFMKGLKGPAVIILHVNGRSIDYYCYLRSKTIFILLRRELRRMIAEHPPDLHKMASKKRVGREGRNERDSG